MTAPLLAVGDKLEIDLDPRYGLGWVRINGFVYHLVRRDHQSALPHDPWEVERVERDRYAEQNG